MVCQNGSQWPFLEQAAQRHTGVSVLLKKKNLREPKMNLTGQAPEEPHLILKGLLRGIRKAEQIMSRGPF